jgi:hypothetical protein
MPQTARLPWPAFFLYYFFIFLRFLILLPFLSCLFVSFFPFYFRTFFPSVLWQLLSLPLTFNSVLCIVKVVMFCSALIVWSCVNNTSASPWYSWYVGGNHTLEAPGMYDASLDGQFPVHLTYKVSKGKRCNKLNTWCKNEMSCLSTFSYISQFRIPYLILSSGAVITTLDTSVFYISVSSFNDTSSTS